MFSLVLSVYLVLLIAGGIAGYAKAGSRVSLIMSLAFAAGLGVCLLAAGTWGRPVAFALQGLLMLVFALRLAKTRKFMPAGMMLAVTGLALVVEVLAAR